jgi:hypothetical protein
MKRKLTNRTGAPVVDNQNTMTAGKRGPALLQDVWFLEKLAHSKTIFCGRKMASCDPFLGQKAGPIDDFYTKNRINIKNKASYMGSKTLFIIAQFNNSHNERIKYHG